MTCQRDAERRADMARAWDEGYERRGDAMRAFGKEAPFHLTPPNPYRTPTDPPEVAASGEGGGL